MFIEDYRSLASRAWVGWRPVGLIHVDDVSVMRRVRHDYCSLAGDVNDLAVNVGGEGGVEIISTEGRCSLLVVIVVWARHDVWYRVVDELMNRLCFRVSIVLTGLFQDYVSGDWQVTSGGIDIHIDTGVVA